MHYAGAAISPWSQEARISASCLRDRDLYLISERLG